METFLFTDALLLGLALLQALVGVLFFRPFAAVTVFFFQCLLLFGGAVIVVGYNDLPYRFWGWVCLLLFAPLFGVGFLFWRRRS